MTLMKKKFLFLLVLLLSYRLSWAVIDIPQNLTKSDREESLRVLGFGTSNKILSDPYPLGGYSGFEFGVAVSTLPTDRLKNLGSKLATGQTDVSYTSFSMGKGLYNNIDIFLSLTPYVQSIQMSQFGGQVRWSFYQAENLPLSFSFLLNANSSNIANQVSLRTLGTDIIGGLNVNRVALFTGIGTVSTAGDFLGGTRGITDSGYQESENVSGFHFLFGVNVRISDYFISAEVDHYRDTVFSGKLGMRL